ncbi:MAG: D-alanine transaminase [Candidatus Latescibacterota bacterium]
MSELAYVNGDFMPLSEAVVSVEDRGFQFADGVYEVIGTYGGKPYAMAAHLQRLERCLLELRLPLDIGTYRLREKIEEGIQRCGYAEALVYVQVTRGVAPRRHEFPLQLPQPTVVMTFKELIRLPVELYEQGVAVISTADLRWKRCDIKSIALLANILAKQEASEKGAFEALLVNEAGNVTEGSSTSAFCVRDGQLWTSPEGPHILPSITRGVLLDLARQAQLPIRETFSSLDDFLAAEEVFLGGTTTEAISVVEIDGKRVGDGKPGPIASQLRAAFLREVGLL